MAHRGRHSADDKLAAALAGGLTVRDAAAAAGVGERTATRRVAEPAFRGRVSALRAEMIHATAGKLSDGMTAAADTLRGLLTHSDDGLKLRAAAKLLELGLRTWQTVELVAQMADLNERLALAEAAVGKPR